MNQHSKIWPSTLLLLAFLEAAAPAPAATYLVTKMSDDNGPCTPDDCAVREAIIAANANPGKDTVIVPPGDYLLSISGIQEFLSYTGDLNIFDHLDLLGDEHQPTIFRSDGTDRVLSIYGLSTVTLSHLTFTGGRHQEGGGGLRIFDSQVTITDSTIRDNETTGAFGGGLAVFLSDVELRNCTITGNSSPTYLGGGIWRVGSFGKPADLTLVNTTVSGNSAYRAGGIVSSFEGTLTLINSTIAANSSTRYPSALTVEWTAGPILVNTLIEGECGGVNFSAPTSHGHNIESPGNTCLLSHPTDRVSVPDLRLGPLADYGGPTLTHALWSDSPAIDSADPTACPADDQRGIGRPVDGDGDGSASCDVGAFELLPQPAAVEVPTLGPAGMIVLALLLSSVAVRAMTRQKPGRYR